MMVVQSFWCQNTIYILQTLLIQFNITKYKKLCLFSAGKGIFSANNSRSSPACRDRKQTMLNCSSPLSLWRANTTLPLHCTPWPQERGGQGGGCKLQGCWVGLTDSSKFLTVADTIWYNLIFWPVMVYLLGFLLSDHFVSFLSWKCYVSNNTVVQSVVLNTAPFIIIIVILMKSHSTK